MYCSKCGKKIGEQEKFCSFCGAKNDNHDQSCEELVQDYLRGNEESFNKIYDKTRNITWTIARSFFPADEMECQDCVQDIYINLYEKIAKFDASKGDFIPWFKKTANNICITRYNKIKKIKEVPIEQTTNTEDSKKEKELVEESLEFNPEARMEQEEVSHLINVILKELPEQQLRCITLFYMNQLKQEEIANILNIPKGTVKSRIFNGKKIIEEKILALEKQGTKLYSMSPIAFFVWLFVQEGNAKTAEIAASGTTALELCKQIESAKNATSLTETKELVKSEATKSSTSTTAKIVGSGAKAAGTKAVATKAIAVIVGAAVIGTGGYAGIKYYNNHNNQEIVNEENKQSIVDLQSIEQSMDMDLMRLVLSYSYNPIKPEYDGLKQGIAGIFEALTTFRAYDVQDETGILEKYVNEISTDSEGNAKINKELANRISMIITGEKVDNQKNLNSVIVDEDGVRPTEYWQADFNYTIVDDVKTKIDKENNQILVSYSEPYYYNVLENSEMINYNYIHRRCANVIPYKNELGYMIASVGDGKFFDDEKLKEIANNLQVPGSMKVSYKQDSKANYDGSLDKYLVKVEVVSEDQIVASALVDYQTGELCDKIMNFREPTKEGTVLAIYQPLIDAYGQYYFNGVETEGILTGDVIFQYGVGNPYQGYPLFSYDTLQEPLYYSLTDLNNDGYEECIFTSVSEQNPQEVYVYDVWTRDDSTFYHVFSGGYRSYSAFCEDGTVMQYGSGGWDTGGYVWSTFDNRGNVTEVDQYFFDSDNPLDENIVNEKKEQHKIAEKPFDFKEIQK